MRNEHAEEVIVLKKNMYDVPPKVNPRGAGRKEKMSASVNRRSDIENMLADLPAEQIAKRLEISRATLFKRLKAAREEHARTGEDPFIL